MKKTKIICTIGPASGTEEILTEMIKNGMNLARVNMSHGSHESNLPYIKLVKEVREKLEAPIGLIFDTKGPEIRIGTFANKDGVILVKGNTFTISTDPNIVGTEQIVSCGYAGLNKDVTIKDKILINDGLIELVVENIKGKSIICKILTGGKLTDRKSAFLPSVHLSIPFLSKQDKEDLLFAIAEDADYIAASFVGCKQNILDMRKFLDTNNGQSIKIISKIESVEGLKNASEIIENSDAIMVARGDLGVELSIEKLPAAQKQLIKKARFLHKPVITATEMLESMIEKTRPTRAETTDVANAIYDETTAIMLSGETAVGKNPALVVKTMAKIAQATEEDINYKKRFDLLPFETQDIGYAISHSTCRVSFDLSAKCIVVWTVSGHTAALVSGFKPTGTIVAVATNKKTFYQLSLNFGVLPLFDETIKTSEEMFDKSEDYAKQCAACTKGDKIIITAGLPLEIVGNTNLIKVQAIK